ncbi:MAG: WD40 repeat domain-containing protein [Kofleriaceae bacterium]
MPKRPHSTEPPPSEPRFLTGPGSAPPPGPAGIVTPPSRCALFGVAVSDQDRFIAVAHDNGVVGLYQPVFAEKMRITGPMIAGRGHERARSVTFEPGSGRGYACFVTGGVDGTIRTWHLEENTRDKDLYFHTASVNSLAFDAASTRLFSGSEDGTIAITRWPDATLERSLTAHDGAVLSVAVSQSASQLASGGADGCVYLWSPTGTRIARIDDGSRGMVWGVHFLDDERVLFSKGGGIFEWSERVGCRLVFKNNERFRSLRGLAVRSDGIECAFGNGNALVTLRLATGDTRQRIGHDGEVNGVAYLADGRIASTADDGALLVWGSDDKPVLRLHAGSA